MKSSLYKKFQPLVLTAMGVLVAILLIYLAITPNIQVEQPRKADGYEVLTNISYREIQDDSATIGMVREFSFLLTEDMEHDSTLVFQFSHQNAQVYLGDELVYSLCISPEMHMVRTPGCNWAMIPLYREDIGQEIRVLLEPVYENYKDQEISFLLGSKLSIYTQQFIRALPEMVLSLVDVLAGLILLCVAIYFSVKKTPGTGFYSLALLAIFLGLWNFTQTDFIPFISSNHTILVYYISLTMLMVCVIPLNKSIYTPGKALLAKMLRIWSALCVLACTAQLAIQLLGILDMREMLKITHGMIVVSSLVLMISSFVQLFSGRKNGHGLWLLSAGIMADMLMYYISDDSTGLLFVLIAVLCYVLMEGIQMFFSYVRQKQMLEEKDTQLTLSRITTMMSQIRSHFVFNILNAISGMCKYDPEKADETVVRFARYLRNNIDIMEDDKPVDFSAELARLEDYVVLEQVRFGDKIEFYTDIQADRFTIPPLILQPVVENAIKHGLTKKQSGGAVILRTWEEGSNIKITIEDDGVGFEPSELQKESSVGLRNISYRLRHLVQGTLDIESQVGVGTTVTITIPKKETASCE